MMICPINVYLILILQAAPVLWGQLTIIMAKVGVFWIPVCYSLLPNKEEDTYLLFLLMLKTVIEEMGLKFEVTKFILDYEVAMAKAVDKVFGAALKGCFFHFSQAIWRYVQTHNMVSCFNSNQEFNSFVKMAIAIAHVPLSDIPDTLEKLRHYKFTTSYGEPGKKFHYTRLISGTSIA